jgi:DNA mismatch repair ATPase MutS
MFAAEMSLVNVKLAEVFDLCVNKEQADEMLAFLRRPSCPETIAANQEFFKEFLQCRRLVELFIDAQKEIILAKRLAAEYEREKDATIKYFLFFRLVKVYLTLLDKLREQTANAQSRALLKFSACLEEFFKDETIKQTFRDVNITNKIVVNAVTSRSFRVRSYIRSIVGYEIEPTKENPPYLDERFAELFRKLGLGETQLPTAKAMDGEMLYSYVWLLAKDDKPLYAALQNFYALHNGIYDNLMSINTGDISVALGVKNLYDYLNAKDIPLCFPEIAPSRDIHILNCHDLSLLPQRINKIVPNDLICNQSERIFILTGVNSGGKTTYLRGLGITMLMFAAGMFVPATMARIPYYSHLTVMFAGSGTNVNRYKIEKQAAYQVLENAGSNSLVLINELFSSANEKDALAEYGKMIQLLQRQSCFCLMITHFYNLTKWVQPYPDIVSIMAATGENNEPTYKIIRSAERYSNVLEILQKYRVSPDELSKY